MANVDHIIPLNEEERLAAVQYYDILDTPPDQAFDRITKLAARFFNVPIALISIVDHDRIWFKSHHGLELHQTGREPGLAASSILQNDVHTITDASLDPAASTNSLVTELGLRFYAAAPLQTSNGYNLGTICVGDFTPRQITSVQKETLKDLAAIVMEEMELRVVTRKNLQVQVAQQVQVLKEREQAEQEANTDVLTGLKNRRAFDIKLECHALQASEEGSDVVVVIIDLDGFKTVNDTKGYEQGDLLLRSFASSLQSVFRKDDTAYRLGSDEFALLLPLKRRGDFERLKQIIQQRLIKVLSQTRQVVLAKVGASAGVAALSEAKGSPQEVVRLADARMYVQKLERHCASNPSS